MVIKKIKLNKPWSAHKKSEVLIVDKKRAEYLISKKIAEEVREDGSTGT